MPHKILVAQGGGPTAVINQSLAGVVLEARRFPGVTQVYGALQGVRGIVNEDLVDSRETVANLEAVAATPAAALGSTRDKPDLKYCQEIFKVLKAHEIDTFFYIGGNDSSDTVRIVAEEAKKSATPCAPSTSPRPSTTTWSATTTRPAIPPRRASSPRPSPAPISTIWRCRASMSPW